METQQDQKEFYEIVLPFFSNPTFTSCEIFNCNGAGPNSFSMATVESRAPIRNILPSVLFGNGLIKIAEAFDGNDTFKGKNTFQNLRETVLAIAKEKNTKTSKVERSETTQTLPHQEREPTSSTSTTSSLPLAESTTVTTQAQITTTSTKTSSQETDHLECLRLLRRRSMSEAKVRNILAAHYFCPLACGGQWFVDSHGSKGSTCEICKQPINIGDTSLGHKSVWHGRADIVIKSSVIKVKTVEPDNEKFASGEPTPKSRKKNLASSSIEEDPSLEDPSFSSIIEVKTEPYPAESESQALAEAIVNAFCEAKQNPSLSRKFIPSFLVSEDRITIIMYNCDLDILLVSDELKIWTEYQPVATATLDKSTLMLVWLSLNFRNYEMIIDDEDELVSGTVCSNFKNIVGEERYFTYLTQVSKPMEPDGTEYPHRIRKEAKEGDHQFAKHNIEIAGKYLDKLKSTLKLL